MTGAGLVAYVASLWSTAALINDVEDDLFLLFRGVRGRKRLLALADVEEVTWERGTTEDGTIFRLSLWMPDLLVGIEGGPQLVVDADAISERLFEVKASEFNGNKPQRPIWLPQRMPRPSGSAWYYYLTLAFYILPLLAFLQAFLAVAFSITG